VVTIGDLTSSVGASEFLSEAADNHERLKRRPVILIYGELLRVLSTGPQRTTKLARICNVPLDRFDSYIAPLLAKNLIRKETTDGHDTFYVTDEGMRLLNDLESVLNRLSP
jgi:predicted transcriptional regulator